MKFKVTSFKRTGLNSDSLVLKNCELEIVTNDNQKIIKITSSFTKYVSIFKIINSFKFKEENEEHEFTYKGIIKTIATNNEILIETDSECEILFISFESYYGKYLFF